MGGMFESGYARGVNATLASLPGFAWPGDLSPARSYLGDDLVAPAPPHLAPTRTPADPAAPADPVSWRDGEGGEPRGPTVSHDLRSLVTDLPPGPGLGPPPDRHRLEEWVRHRVWVELPRP